MQTVKEARTANKTVNDFFRSFGCVFMVKGIG